MNDLNGSLFAFAVRCLKFIQTLLGTPEFKIIKYQLAKSSTSSGANYEESQAGSSRADFANKIKISLREMRESNYWLRIIEALNNENRDNAELCRLLKESEELKKILGSISRKTQK